ncbi:hypothetical protein AJ79_06920 [Helicocarpus griseus UAMH5409]|uniref:Uncharacterized protein n=1 Tax=Helicocarpus griseus UAMH5409 TaxID=1447875 RepID=A0A2B7X856_9EURO|nr:hypothetical protein AJ79_06920 [Helicocarpus griseus UAMH5409]
MTWVNVTSFCEQLGITVYELPAVDRQMRRLLTQFDLVNTNFTGERITRQVHSILADHLAFFPIGIQNRNRFIDVIPLLFDRMTLIKHRLRKSLRPKKAETNKSSSQPNATPDASGTGPNVGGNPPAVPAPGSAEQNNEPSATTKPSEVTDLMTKLRGFAIRVHIDGYSPLFASSYCLLSDICDDNIQGNNSNSNNPNAEAMALLDSMDLKKLKTIVGQNLAHSMMFLDNRVLVICPRDDHPADNISIRSVQELRSAVLAVVHNTDGRMLELKLADLPPANPFKELHSGSKKERPKRQCKNADKSK